MTSLPERVLQTIRRHGLLRGGDIVLAAVSGGPDSVALLDVLCALRVTLGLSLACAHVHHGLRPEADGDAEFVERLADRLDVPFHLERAMVRRAPPWEGLQAEARRARYAALAVRASALNATRIATGHTADDQAETVLMRLLEGAGPRGLAGIAPARGAFIRPLLETPRDDILAHLRSRGLGWVEDATNRDRRFLRNRVRHEVVPFLGDVFGARAVESLCRSAALTLALITALDRQAETELRRLATRSSCGFVFPVVALERLPEELAAETLTLAACELGESRSRRAAAHRAIRRLLRAGAPPSAVRLGRLSIEKSGAWLRVGPSVLPPLIPRRLHVPGTLELTEIGARLDARCFERGPDFVPPRETSRVAFDAERLPPVLDVRGRRTGDRFAPFGGCGSRRVKSFLIDAGIPRWDRPRLPLLESAGEIVWIAGVRRASAAAIRADTKRILEVTLNSL